MHYNPATETWLLRIRQAITTIEMKFVKENFYCSLIWCTNIEEQLFPPNFFFTILMYFNSIRDCHFRLAVNEF